MIRHLMRLTAAAVVLLPGLAPGQGTQNGAARPASPKRCLVRHAQNRPGVLQPRCRLANEGGVRQGHRRLHRGDPPRPQARRGLWKPAGAASARTATSTGPSPTSPRAGPRPQVRARLQRAGRSMGREGRRRQGHRRPQRGDPAQPQVCRRLLQPEYRLRKEGRPRPGRRQLERGDPARPQVPRRVRQPRQSLDREGES